jgi:methyl-accepting chemotaxis protein
MFPMHILSHLRLRTKLALLMGMSTLAVIISVAAGGFLMQQRMIDDRVDKLRAVVQSAIGMAKTLNTAVTSGEITQEQASPRPGDPWYAFRQW